MKYCTCWNCDDMLFKLLIPIPIIVYLHRTKTLYFNNKSPSSYNLSINLIWLVNSSLSFYLISSQRDFSNRKKQWCQGRTKWCQKITVLEHLVGEFALVHLNFGSCTSPTDTFPFTYHPFNGPGMCAVDNLQRLIFGNSRSPDKFTGTRKTQIIVYV